MREGWLCPRCKKINSPDVKQCLCPIKKEDNNYNPISLHVSSLPTFTWSKSEDDDFCLDSMKRI